MAKQPLKFSVGLEIHARLKTSQKIFCACANRYGDEPDANTCPVCLGLPGSLPVFNPQVLEPAIRSAVALDCQLPPFSEFSRKNYFYPDLPRNYQITQYERPLALGGHLVAGPAKSRFEVRLQRIHLEEDAGRILSHDGPRTRVDFNRAGTPLIEIVTEPDLLDGESARIWLVRLRQLLRWLDVCDGDMEKGSLRCDANVGLKGGGVNSGPWVELKNLNSFKAVGLAVDHEIQRLGRKVELGEMLRRETRAWDKGSRSTSLLRIKESAADYRYFPDPDLPLLELDDALLKRVADHLQELPMAREDRFRSNFGLNEDEATIICRTSLLANYFESCIEAVTSEVELSPARLGQLAANWILGPVLNAVGGQDSGLARLALGPKELAQIIELQASDSINRSVARQIVDTILHDELPCGIGEFSRQQVQESGLAAVELEQLCEDALSSNEDHWKALLRGKAGLLNYFVGWVMSRAQSGTQAHLVRDIISQKLSDQQKEEDHKKVKKIKNNNQE